MKLKLLLFVPLIIPAHLHAAQPSPTSLRLQMKAVPKEQPVPSAQPAPKPSADSQQQPIFSERLQLQKLLAKPAASAEPASSSMSIFKPRKPVNKHGHIYSCGLCGGSYGVGSLSTLVKYHIAREHSEFPEEQRYFHVLTHPDGFLRCEVCYAPMFAPGNNGRGQFIRHLQKHVNERTLDQTRIDEISKSINCSVPSTLHAYNARAYAAFTKQLQFHKSSSSSSSSSAASSSSDQMEIDTPAVPSHKHGRDESDDLNPAPRKKRRNAAPMPVDLPDAAPASPQEEWGELPALPTPFTGTRSQELILAVLYQSHNMRQKPLQS